MSGCWKLHHLSQKFNSWGTENHRGPGTTPTDRHMSEKLNCFFGVRADRASWLVQRQFAFTASVRDALMHGKSLQNVDGLSRDPMYNWYIRSRIWRSDKIRLPRFPIDQSQFSCHSGAISESASTTQGLGARERLRNLASISGGRSLGVLHGLVASRWAQLFDLMCPHCCRTISAGVGWPSEGRLYGFLRVTYWQLRV
jgi:hypothetical protein